MTIDLILEKMKEQGRTESDFDIIKKAYEFAEKIHKNQKRKSGEPYIVHPLAAALRLVDMRGDTSLIAAALLHDTLEDGKCTFEDLKNKFGGEIAFLIEGVTKLDRIKYHGAERSAESLRKMFLAIGQDLRIVLLKLVDRLHNMETLQHLPPEKQKRIARETLEIYAPLCYRLGMTELSGRLEDLAFPYVFPDEYKKLIKETEVLYKNLSGYMEKLMPVLQNETRKEKIDIIDIHARAKHFYSLYKKLLKYDMELDKITDIVAMRVIVPSIEDCYAVLGIIHKLWRPMPGKIKDYIALPKPNGYRSLHTTIFGPEERLVEIQIRTPEMHKEAEHGIAAHWAYSEQKRSRQNSYANRKSSFLNEKKFSWLQQIQEWQKEFENPDEFLESIKIDFFKNRIFVLTPKGDVFDLPEGSTPIDFAYHIHTDIGNASTGAKVNGKMVALNHELQNGDIVQILTQKGRKPSQDWLKFMKYSHAKKKVMSTLKKIEEEKKFDKKGGEPVELKIGAHDRIGILRDINLVFSKQKVQIKSLITDTKNRTWPLHTATAIFKNRSHLEKTIVELKKIKDIEEVNYKLL